VVIRGVLVEDKHPAVRYSSVSRQPSREASRKVVQVTIENGQRDRSAQPNSDVDVEVRRGPLRTSSMVDGRRRFVTSLHSCTKFIQRVLLAFLLVLLTSFVSLSVG